MNFALIGNGPLTNRGCEAIVKGTVKILEKQFGPSHFTLASFVDQDETPLLWQKNIESLPLDYRCPRFSRRWWKRQFGRVVGSPRQDADFLKPFLSQNKMRKFDAVLSIGGDNYAIDYGHTIIDMLMIADTTMIDNDLPSIIWGASIGPFTNEPEFEKKIADHFSKVGLIVVREPASAAYLDSLNVKNYVVAPDPAFMLEAVECQMTDEINRLFETHVIGLNLSPLLARYTTNGDHCAWIALGSKIVESFVSRYGHKVLLIPHVTSLTNNRQMDDHQLLCDITEKISAKYKDCVHVLPRNLNSENLKWVISKLHVFVGARAHSTIAALSSEVPCLSIAYSRKAWGINELVFGHTEWVVSSNNLSQALLVKMDALLEEHAQLKAFLREKIPLLKAQSLGCGLAVYDLLDRD